MEMCGLNSKDKNPNDPGRQATQMTKSVADKQYPVTGAGLGLRRGIMDVLRENPPSQVDFMEVAPENWIGVGGALGRKFRYFTERYPFVVHGLSMSLGGPAPLDTDFIQQVKTFIHTHGIRLYSEHLSYCGDDGHLYDLMPIPFTNEAADYVAGRIRQVQDMLGQRIAVENVSYYAAPGSEMSELEFINEVLVRADCDLLLDVNNIYVNSINHGYDSLDFLQGLPVERVRYFHIAGHYVEAEDLRVDTHGSDVCNPVWKLLEEAYRQFGVVPTLLERDFNIPPLPQLLKEVEQIHTLQEKWTTRSAGSVPRE
jgi:uncharacterized protein (UPF0276 family)